MFDLEAVQAALREHKLDGWLFYDFRGSNPLARRILDFPADKFTTRRFYYFIPAQGSPRKLCHRIETDSLDHLPGERRLYLRWRELETELRRLLDGTKTIAMEYSPRNAIPYVSLADGGTIELVTSLGLKVVSSGDLVQRFEATLDDDQLASHVEAERHLISVSDAAWRMIAERVRGGSPPRETEVQTLITDYFAAHRLFTDHPPIVGVGPHSGNPHYMPGPLTDAAIRKGDFVLIDLWCKLDRPRAVFADYTYVGFVGEKVPAKYAEVFGVVRDARDAGVDRVREAFESGKPVRGFEVDDAARGVIEKAGHGAYFVHRTGHNISTELHGNGTHMDNLETHDDRLILKRTCFSVEPGIYTEEFGVRSEVNVYIDGDGRVHVTGRPQGEVKAVLGG